jgi:hypothetical protein
MKCKEFLDCPRKYYLLNKDFAPWRYLVILNPSKNSSDFAVMLSHCISK